MKIPKFELSTAVDNSPDVWGIWIFIIIHWGIWCYGKICLQPDKESLIKIPKIESESIPLCFSNVDIAKNRFGPPGNQGKAIVAIDNFRLRLGDAFPFDEAELIKTIEIIK